MSRLTHARAIDDLAEAIGQPRRAEDILESGGNHIYDEHYAKGKIANLRQDLALYEAKQRHPSGKNINKKEATNG